MLLDPDTDALQRHRRSRNDDIFSIVQRKLAQGNGPALDQRRLDGKAALGHWERSGSLHRAPLI